MEIGFWPISRRRRSVILGELGGNGAGETGLGSGEGIGGGRISTAALVAGAPYPKPAFGPTPTSGLADKNGLCHFPAPAYCRLTPIWSRERPVAKSIASRYAL